DRPAPLRLGEGVQQRSIALTALTHAERDLAGASRRRKRLLAFTFVAPLLLFILLSFVAPIASMLWRSVYHPTVAELIPATLEQLEQWDDDSQTPPWRSLPRSCTDWPRSASPASWPRSSTGCRPACPAWSSPPHAGLAG